MTGYACQFMRVEGYGHVPNPKRKKNGHRSARQVIEELVREPHASPHVENPLPPRIIAGDPYQTLANAKKRAEGFVDPLGRKLRRDAHIVAGLIVSYPVAVEKVSVDEHEAQMLDKWIGEVHEWAKREFGEVNIDCVVQHMDETNPHLHIMLLRPEPSLDPSPLMRAAKAARAVAKKEGKHKYRNDLNLIEKAAFRAAGRQLQDSLHEQVSVYYGHQRISDAPRTRMPNPMFKKVKAQQATLRKTIEVNKQRERELLEKIEELQQQQRMLEEAQMRLDAKEAELKAEAEELAAYEASIAARESRFRRMLLSPAATLVNKMLEYGANAVRANIGAEGAKALASAIQYARTAMSLPEINIGTAAGDIGEAQLNQMFRDINDSQRKLLDAEAHDDLLKLMTSARPRVA